MNDCYLFCLFIISRVKLLATALPSTLGVGHHNFWFFIIFWNIIFTRLKDVFFVFFFVPSRGGGIWFKLHWWFRKLDWWIWWETPSSQKLHFTGKFFCGFFSFIVIYSINFCSFRMVTMVYCVIHVWFSIVHLNVEINFFQSINISHQTNISDWYNQLRTSSNFCYRKKDARSFAYVHDLLRR